MPLPIAAIAAVGRAAAAFGGNSGVARAAAAVGEKLGPAVKGLNLLSSAAGLVPNPLSMATKAIGAMQAELGKAAGAIGAFRKGIDQVAGAMGSVASLVGKFDPALVILFERAVADLNAVLGSVVRDSFKAMLDGFKQFSAVVNTVGPEGRKMLASLLAGGAALAALTAGLAAVLVVGNPLVLTLGLMAGALVKSDSAMKSVSAITKVVATAFEKVAALVNASVETAVGQAMPLIESLAKSFAGMVVQYLPTMIDLCLQVTIAGLKMAFALGPMINMLVGMGVSFVPLLTSAMEGMSQAIMKCLPQIVSLCTAVTGMFDLMVRAANAAIAQWNKSLGSTLGYVRPMQLIGAQTLTADPKFDKPKSAAGMAVGSASRGSAEDIGLKANAEAFRSGTGVSEEVKAAQDNGKRLDEIKAEIANLQKALTAAAAAGQREARAAADKPPDLSQATRR